MSNNNLDNSDKSQKIFSLIKELNDDDMIQYITQNPDIDYNVQDVNGIYFIFHVISLNKLSVLRSLLKLKIKIDGWDLDGKTIAYTPLKFGYNEIIKELIHYDKTIIGIPIQDITDINGNIALHYAIMFRNIECVKILTPLSKCSLHDKDKKNALHYAVNSRSLETVKLIIPLVSDINSQDKYRNTALYIACNLVLPDIVAELLKSNADTNIYSQDIVYPIHTACAIGNEVIVKSLLDYGADINVIDYEGYTPMHVCCATDKIQIAKILINYKLTKTNSIGINVNIANSFNSIPLHLVFLKQLPNFLEFIDLLIEKSNLNIQNMNGDSCLHLLCRNALWKRYHSILITKKLNIVTINKKNERPIDYVDDADKKQFIDMVIDSYQYILIHSSHQWRIQWEVDCKNDTKLCRENIEDYVLSLLKKKSIGCEDRTYPFKSVAKCINIPIDERVSFNTLTGHSIEYLAGSVLLHQKYSNATIVMPRLQWLDNICNQSNNLSEIIKNTQCSMFPDMILWDDVDKSLSVIEQVDQLIIKSISDINIRFIVIPTSIVFGSNIGHANAIIYDKKTNELERFDPAGAIGKNQLFDNKLSNHFSKLIKNVKYIRPSDFMKVGIQNLDITEKYMGDSNIGDPIGFCVAWSFWYADMRMRYPEIKRDKLVKYVISQINTKDLRYRTVIRNYASNITKIRDQVLSKINLDINMFINGNYSQEQNQQLYNEFEKMYDTK